MRTPSQPRALSLEAVTGLMGLLALFGGCSPKAAVPGGAEAASVAASPAPSVEAETAAKTASSAEAPAVAPAPASAAAPASAPAPAAAEAAATSAPTLIPPVASPKGKPVLLPATPQVALDIVLPRQLREAAAADQDVLIYVGASWCAPCRSFHDALLQGRFDALLPGVRFVEFDNDADGERLRALGYTWTYVPLFARPRSDGSASGQQFGGVPHEALEDPIPHLAGRISELLGRSAPEPGAAPAAANPGGFNGRP
jgi:thiol-disulfide isomerase/thioredoxin